MVCHIQYYCGTEGTSKNNQYNCRFNNFNRRFDPCTIANSTLKQRSILRLYNGRFDVCTTVESTLVQSSNQCLCNRRINASTTVDSTGLQLLIRCLKNRGINACATVESTLVQMSLHLYNCRFDPCKKSLFCFILVRNIANINTNRF